MLKKIFNPKRKHQEQGKPKITLDQASQNILSRHFSPLPSRAKSPSDVLDIVGYPLIVTTTGRRKSVTFRNNSSISIYNKPALSQSSPELSTPAEKKPYRQQQQLTIRNTISPPQEEEEEELDNDQVLLLEASREEKTLVEKELLLETKNLEVYRLQQKLLILEKEREMMNQKFQDFIEREEQLRSIIEENQFQINQLKYYNNASSSSWYSRDMSDEEDPMYQRDLLYYHYYPPRRHSNRRRYNYYPRYYYYPRKYI